MNEQSNRGWKWAAIILVALFVMMITCLLGAVAGGLIGFAIGRGTARIHPYPMPERFEMPYELPEPGEEPSLPEGQGRPWLGVAFARVDRGAEVSVVVPGSPAEEAGIRPGDLITEVDGERITEEAPLDEHILRYKPGDRVRLTLLRDDSKQRVTVRLASRMDRFPSRQDDIRPLITPLPPDRRG